MVIVQALIVVLAGGVLALLFAFGKTRWIYGREVKKDRLKEIGGFISEGAMAFLRREYLVLLPFIILVAVFLFFGNSGALRWQSGAFVLGALASALAGYIGMKVATAANMRTTQAAHDEGLNAALRVAFSGGSVMGMSVVGLALVGLFVVFFVSSRALGVDENSLREVILPLGTAFSLGASSIALFARVGGGIFTKAADVAADLVGKVEAGIPEDDPRNPATIADNVGDNVGDVAGMGADLFESFVGSIVGSMILGMAVPAEIDVKIKLMVLPLLIAAVGVIASILGTLVVRTKQGGNPQRALNIGTFGAGGAAIVFVFILLMVWIGDMTLADGTNKFQLLGAIVSGLVAGIVIGQITEYYTGTNKRPVNAIVKSCDSGPATTIISGVGVGMQSTFPTVVIIAAGIFVAYLFAGLYGVGIAAVGMLVTIGIQLAVDAYGPIADNAGGLSEMSGFPHEVREITDKLDAVGNTTAAIGKGFAIGSAALTAIILFSSFRDLSGLKSIEITNTNVLIGILIGSVIPFLFSALAMTAVGKAAFEMIAEVRRQFREMPGILTGEETPDYRKCVDISTRSALKEMLLPGLIAIASPIAVGFLGGPAMLMGLLTGVTITGVGLAIFMSNSGGAWDNAKKMIEADDGGRGTEAHKAAVVGDTVGDPFKDTAGPALNILIKIMSMVALVIAPMLRNFWG